LFVQYSGGNPFAVSRDPFFGESFESRFTLYSAELQQIFESPEHAFIFGARYQFGEVENDALLMRGITGVVTDQSSDETLQRASAYGYYHWRPVTWMRFTAGVSYDYLKHPQNVDLPPFAEGTENTSRVSPKAGLTIQPWQGGYLRAAWSRSLGGLYFDESIRLEPTQIAGFANTFRSLIPESVAGLVAGTEFETWGVGFDQQFDSGTYLGVTAELLRSDAARSVGAFTNATFIQEPNAPTNLRERLDYEERSVSAYLSQLIGKNWAIGARYRISESDLETRYPGLPSFDSLRNVEQEQTSTLQHAQLFARFNHACGGFAEWTSDWYHQNNDGNALSRAGDDFWQHNIFIGYRFPRHHAELRFGVLNLTEQDYRLDPLNLHDTLARKRTFVTSLRINF
jgi:outer membrane receptor protein involved in Fe transport